MADINQTVSEFQAFAQPFRAMLGLADKLSELGSLEQVANETESRKAQAETDLASVNARKELAEQKANQADERWGDVDAQIEAKRTERMNAQDQELADARKADEAKRADEIAEHNAQLAEIQAQISEATDKAKELATDNAKAADELVKTQTMLDDIKARFA